MDDAAAGVNRAALAMALTSARLSTGRRVVLLTIELSGALALGVAGVRLGRGAG